jgi:predicted RNA-binding Zn-ribbon protein involved in translation (DUF1610 family)
MRRVRTEEELKKEQPMVKGEASLALCGVCGAVLELDEESHEYLCPVCDREEQQ